MAREGCGELWLTPLSYVQVVGVELLGYRKRLQYGIAELRRAHPRWVGRDATPSPSKGSPVKPVSQVGTAVSPDLL